MFFVFRTDANPAIGTGHLMRCLALAEALRQGGGRCLFLCRGAGLGGLADKIAGAGHELLALPEGPAADPSEAGLPPHARWLPHGWQHDAASCRQLLAGYPVADWLIVDHYALDERWEQAMAPVAGQRLAIDDLADRRHDCALLLDQNLLPGQEARYAGKLPAACSRLFGPQHALLRPQFAAARQRTANARHGGGPCRLLVMFGGADRDDLTGQTVSLIAGLGLDLVVEVVAGPLYAHRERLEQRLQGLPRATLHVAPEHIADLMAAADLAIGSPGTTSWERCALGLPSIAIAVADNQEAMAAELARRGAHLYLGRDGELARSDLAAALRLLAGNPLWREAMGKIAAGITDGQGASRLARRLTMGAIAIRRAGPADAQALYGWRNDPRIRAHAFDPAPIAWDSHLAWFEAALQNPDRLILVASQHGADVGSVRFDLGGKRARVSIYLNPARIGEGLAIPILNAADAWLAGEFPDTTLLVAEVMAGNDASRAAFVGAGYRLEHMVFTKPCGLDAAPDAQP